ncbi:MAG TPA: SxtJ family membrane protein [Polyangiales bacterium]|nr:SxtJ family membrane protein [Polyangiales bacterium]
MRPAESKPSPRELKRFGSSVAAGLCVLSLAAYFGRGPLSPLGPSPILAVALACAALGIAGLSLFAPQRNRGLYRGVRAIGEPLGRGLAFLSLLVFFFGVLTPVALLARLVGHDPLQLRRRSRRDSYWRPHRARDSSSYFHQS